MCRSSKQMEQPALGAAAHTASAVDPLLSQWSGDWGPCMLLQNKGGIRMAEDTILYISDHGPRSSSILAALEATGYDVVSAGTSTQAIALLFVMHSVTAVVLDQHSVGESSFDLTHGLRALRQDVPIVLLCTERTDRLPPAVDACVNKGQPLENLKADLQRLLAEKPAAESPNDCCSCASPSI
jgi:CheY-like chemotaxis protein